MLRPYVERDNDTVLVCDGGDIGQWAQSILPARRRMVNGVSGAIGSSLSLALAVHGLELTPARYDLVVSALGGHFELVTEAAEFAGAIERSLASGKASCVNVMTESIAAPVVRLAS